jgi:hypothetical protein
VAVHNIGQGTVTLLDLGEEYIVTFPSGYCRNILGVPWVELGGKVSTSSNSHFGQFLSYLNGFHFIDFFFNCRCLYISIKLPEQGSQMSL